MKSINIITLVLVIIGGLNWGLVGAINLDLVAAIFGADTLLSRIIYVLVGVSALWQLNPLIAALRSHERSALRGHSFN